ncbi:MAG: MFS transporter [Frankia sp.]
MSVPAGPSTRRADGLIRTFAVSNDGAKLLAIGLVDSIGTGLYLAGSAIFFTTVVGLSTSQVGLGLSLAGLVGFFLQAPLGRLADQVGPRRMLIALNLWRAAGFVSYVFVHDFVAFLVVATFLGAPEQANYSVNQALSEQVVGPEKRIALVARVRAVYNIGFTGGALLAAVAISQGSRPAFYSLMIGNAVTFVLAAAALPHVHLRIPDAGAPPAPAPAGPRGRRLTAVRDGRYVAVAAVNAVMALHMSLLSIGIPLWVTLHTDAPNALVGPLLVVNTVLAIALQVRVSRGTDSVEGSVTAMRRAGWALALCCALFAVAGELPATAAVVVLILAIVAETFGELFQSAGGWGLSYGLAPGHSRTEYLATFNLGSSAQFVLGPTIVTVGVVDQGVIGWAALGAAFLLFAQLTATTSRAAERRMRPGTQPPPLHRAPPENMLLPAGQVGSTPPENGPRVAARVSTSPVDGPTVAGLAGVPDPPARVPS